MFCGCLLSAVLVCLLYFNQIFKSCNSRGPCRSTSLSRTLRDLPERLHAACSTWGMMAGTRCQAPAAAALVLSSPPCLAVTPARRGWSEAARGLSQGELLRDESALHMLSVRRGDFSGFRLGDVGPLSSEETVVWAAAPRAAACSLLSPGSLTLRRAASQYPRRVTGGREAIKGKRTASGACSAGRRPFRMETSAREGAMQTPSVTLPV